MSESAKVLAAIGVVLAVLLAVCAGLILGFGVSRLDAQTARWLQDWGWWGVRVAAIPLGLLLVVVGSVKLVRRAQGWR